ncbi:MAG: HrpE/YscL family type III secretion apparatus protein [Acetivibrio sp.]
MGTSRIEQSIEDIYEFIEGCKTQPLFSTRVIVPKDELYDLLDELRMRAPDEIKRYKKVIANREAILEDAQKKADALMEEAHQKTENLINESEIVQQAYFQANQIVSQATEEANRMMSKAAQESDQIRISALAYTNDLLADAEHALSNAYQSATEKYEGLTSTLKYGLDTIQNNRAELGLDKKSDSLTENPKETPEDIDFEEDFNFDENTFLEDIK